MHGRANRKSVPDTILIRSEPAAARFDPVQALGLASYAVGQVTTTPAPVARRLGNGIPVCGRRTQYPIAAHRHACPPSTATVGTQEVAL